MIPLVKDSLEHRRYMRSPEWMERRLKAIARAGWRCEICGRGSQDERKYQVHHRSYDHLGAELGWELQALCRHCHKRVSRVK